MAVLNIREFIETHLSVLESFKVEDPWWLLLAIVPVILFLFHVFKRSKIVDVNYASPLVHDATVVINRKWPSRFITMVLLLTMLLLVYPAARPVSNISQAQEKALLIWVYDASESMETKDVVKNDTLISRLDASVSALEESLATIPPDLYKLLVSFSGSDEVEVGLLTLNSQQLLEQARNIPSGERTATDFGLERAVSACEQFFNNEDNLPCEIFLLSDGECNPRPNCRIRSEEIAHEAKAKGVIIHTISWGNPESDYRPNPKDMQAIAKIGDGQHLSSVKTSELADLYSNVATSLEVQNTQQALAAPYAWVARLAIIALALAFLLRRLE